MSCLIIFTIFFLHEKSLIRKEIGKHIGKLKVSILRGKGGLKFPVTLYLIFTKGWNKNWTIQKLVDQGHSWKNSNKQHLERMPHFSNFFVLQLMWCIMISLIRLWYILDRMCNYVWFYNCHSPTTTTSPTTKQP